MRFVAFRQRHAVVCVATATLLVAGGIAAPIPAHALTVTPLGPSICQVTSLSVASLPAVSPTLSAMSSPPSFNLSVGGNCYSPLGSTAFTISGSGDVVNSGTCAAFASITGGGLLDWGGQTGIPVDFDIAGTAADATLAIDTQAIATGGTIAASFGLTLSLVSLESCAGGATTTLQYTGEGTVVIG